MPPATLSTPTPEAPFYIDEGGAARVTGTRFPIEGIILNWIAGESPEAIARSFDPLDLARTYAVIAYYLSHREELDAYIAQRDAEAEEGRKAHEALFPPVSREEFLRRRAERGASLSR